LLKNFGEKERFQKFCSRCKNLEQPNYTPAFWTVAALCRYCVISLQWKKRQRAAAVQNLAEICGGLSEPGHSFN
jgi:hypothetical protein